MANLIKQKYLEGIDSSKFKIEQGGAIKAENSSGTLVDVFKFDTAQNIVKIYNDKQVADTDFVNGLITQEISDRNAAISQAISDLINGAPAALDTLKEISDALAEDQTALDGLLQDLTTYVKLDGSRAFTNNIDAGSFKVVNLANGMMSTEAVNKGQLDSGVQEAKDYTDNLEDRALLLNGSQSMTAALQMNSNKIEGLANGMMSTDAVNKGQLDSGVQEAKDYTDNLEDRALLLNGSQSMTGALQMNSYKIEGLANGMMSTDAVNKGQLDSGVQEAKDYTDNLEDRALLLNGSQSMTGALQMNSYKIEGLANGMMSTDAVNKGQLDSVEQGLQSQITTEKDRVDAILSMSQADKDSFVEIVDLINSIDTGNSDALAGHLVDAEDAHDASAISVVPAGNLAATEVQGALEELQVHIDTVEQSVTNLDAYAQEVRSDLEQEILDRGAADVVLQGNIDAEVTARIADVDAEETRAIAAEGVLQGNIDTEIADRIAAVSDEEAARIAEDATLLKLNGSREMQGSLIFASGADIYEPGIQGTPVSYNIYTAVGGNLGYYGEVGGVFQSGSNEPYFTINSASGNTVNFTLTQEETLYFSVYTTELSGVNSQPITYPIGTHSVVIDELSYFVSAGYGHQVKNIENPSDPKDATNKQWVEEYVTSYVSATKDFMKETFEIDVSAELEYIELSETPVMNSLVVFVNRLAVHEDVDYTVSVVDGITRLTWEGEFAVGGIEEIELGDFIRVTYMY